MNARLVAALVVVAMLACRAPAIANGTTNTIVAGIAAITAAFGINNYEMKTRIKRQELHEQERRMGAYREWYLRKFRRYPTDREVYVWYLNAYGVKPLGS